MPTPIPTDTRHAAATMAAPSVHQRIWKVSSALDRLSMMCEQHKLQTKHVDGKPDWSTPSAPAGVPTREYVRVPANFAWEFETTKQSEPVKTIEREDHRAMNDTVANIANDLGALAYSTEKNALPRRDPQSTMPVLSLQEAGERPTRTNSAAVEQHSPTVHVSAPRYLGDGGAGAMYDGFTELPRRRKVQFADQGRSYRGSSRSKKLADHLTFHEAVHSISPIPASYTMKGPAITPSTTLHQPSRFAVETGVPHKRRGDLRAEMEMRHEGRRVLTADDAMQVARESAQQFLKRPPTSSSELKSQAKDPRDESVSHKSTPTLEVPVPTTSPTTESELVSLPASAPEPSETKELHPVVTNRPVYAEISTQTEPQQAAPSLRSKPLQQTIAASPPCSHCHGTGREPVPPPPLDLPPPPKPQVATKKPVKQATAPPPATVPARKPLVPRTTRPTRPPQPTHRFNPIFANARYPPEPPTFRAKSTYKTDFPTSKPLRR